MTHFILWINLFVFALMPVLQNSGDLEARAREFLDQLVQGQYEAAVQDFDQTMLSVIPPDRLKAVWEETVASYGAFEEVTAVEQVVDDPYTAVILKSRFERAVVNVRVTFTTSTGEISGLFFTPVEAIGGISPGFLAAMGVSAVFVILYPIVLGIITNRRWGVSWRIFLIGAGIFIIFQLVTRIPLISVAQVYLTPLIQSSRAFSFAWIVFLSLTAGLFEEFGRYVGYRWMLPRDPKTWKTGVMYGLGHGGIEAIVLVGVTQVVTFVILSLFPVLQGSLPAEVLAPLSQTVAAAAGSPDYLPLLAAWERLWTVLFHVALSLIVLQVFRRGRFAWIWAAVALHTAGNLFVIGIPMLFTLGTQSSALLSSALILIVGLFAVWIIWRLRKDEDEVEVASAAVEG
ncbi:MAG: YhfC family intramembrane metalloprotease [Chloroflexi bacterium]|nr:YhfC family intramembrane metalloprotease [Chloroflexota bacterium]